MAVGLPWRAELAGRIEELEVESSVLADNPLGDPARRPLLVYVPPGYDDHPDRRYPSVYVLQGYTGHVAMWHNRSAFKQPFWERADALFAGGGAPPCLLVFVDAWTAYGGSQFVDSPGTGRYHTYLCDEVVPFVDARFRTLDDPAHRGLQGKSSGGFGAVITAMARPDLFGGLATHSGDALYECSYLPEFPKAARALQRWDGSIGRFWEDFCSREPFSRGEDHLLVMLLAVSACFSADPDGTPRLPFDPATGRVVPEVWNRWLAWDPVRMVADHADALRAQRAVWIDAGNRDEWYLDLGAAALRDALAAVGVTDVHFELFDGGHSGTDWRYPLSLAYLANRLA